MSTAQLVAVKVGCAGVVEVLVGGAGAVGFGMLVVDQPGYADCRMLSMEERMAETEAGPGVAVGQASLKKLTMGAGVYVSVSVLSVTEHPVVLWHVVVHEAEVSHWTSQELAVFVVLQDVGLLS